MKIGILGLGGVGGFIGAKLALYYKGSDTQIIFVTRGKNLETIKHSGLKLQSPSGEEVSFPHMVTNDPFEIGRLDLLICCIKSYDLEESISFLSSCIDENTFVLPLLNGVDAADRIKSIVPYADVLEGCIYIVSQLIAPGVIKQAGSLCKVYFGSNTSNPEALIKIEKMFRNANINAINTSDISSVIWEKFLFISPLATITSYLNLGIGEILSNENHKAELTALMHELKAIIDAKKIVFQDNLINKNLEKLYSLPPETTSSMHNDFQRGHKAEVHSLTGIVSDLGKETGVSTPTYDMMLMAL